MPDMLYVSEEGLYPWRVMLSTVAYVGAWSYRRGVAEDPFFLLLLPWDDCLADRATFACGQLVPHRKFFGAEECNRVLALA